MNNKQLNLAHPKIYIFNLFYFYIDICKAEISDLTRN